MTNTFARERNQVERLVGRLKECRRVATRYEKTARNYLAFASWRPSWSSWPDCQ